MVPTARSRYPSGVRKPSWKFPIEPAYLVFELSLPETVGVPTELPTAV